MTTKLTLASLTIALMATTAMAGQRHRTLVLNADDHFRSDRVVVRVDRPMKTQRHHVSHQWQCGARYASRDVAIGARVSSRDYRPARNHWRTGGDDIRFVGVDTKAVKAIGLKKGSTKIVAGRIGDRKGLIAKRSNGKIAMLLRR